MLALRLSAETEQRLNALAARTGRSKSFYARQAIETYINDLEEQYWEDEVIARWEASDKKTVSAAELRTELGL